MMGNMETRRTIPVYADTSVLGGDIAIYSPLEVIEHEDENV